MPRKTLPLMCFKVLDARLRVLEHLSEAGNVLDSQFPLEDGILLDSCKPSDVPFMEGSSGIAHDPRIAQVFEGRRPYEFFNSFFGEPCLTLKFKV